MRQPDLAALHWQLAEHGLVERQLVANLDRSRALAEHGRHVETDPQAVLGERELPLPGPGWWGRSRHPPARRADDLLAVICSIRNHPQDCPITAGATDQGVLSGRAPTKASRMLRPRPCLYTAGTAEDMTCGICGLLRFGLTGDAWGGGRFLALVVPDISA